MAADSAFMKTVKSPVLGPEPAEFEVARQASRRLGRLLGQEPQVNLRCQTRKTKRPASVPIPMTAFRMLVQILAEMGEGKAVTMVPLQREMTTQEAADFLEMSRPSLLKLLEQGGIRFRRIGKHRRVLFEDLVDYRRQTMSDRHAALDELTEQAQKLGLGY
jgi:excisionase family DNA binding protein